MKEAGKSGITRRQFGLRALGYGTMATLGVEAATLGRRVLGRPGRVFAAASQADINGPNTLQAHAATHQRLFGAAVVPSLLDVDGVAAGHTTDAYTQLYAAQTGILVAENEMKWSGLRPAPDRFDFTQADRMIRFAQLTGKKVRGHNLCWHQALPGWFAKTATKDNARQLLTDHIRAVAGHFRAQIHSWDVVNEAIAPEDGQPDGLRNSPWFQLIGPDYIELAFRTAAEADPQAILTYNEYGIETDWADNVEKRARMLALLRRLKAAGVPVGALGLQAHLSAHGAQPGPGVVELIREAGRMGLQVYVTEMDVNDRGVEGDTAARQEAVAKVYRNFLKLVLPEPNAPLVLTWGLLNGKSWLHYQGLNDPKDKRPLAQKIEEDHRQEPLLFDDDYNPVPAFWAVREALDTAPAA